MLSSQAQTSSSQVQFTNSSHPALEVLSSGLTSSSSCDIATSSRPAKLARAGHLSSPPSPGHPTQLSSLSSRLQLRSHLSSFRTVQLKDVEACTYSPVIQQLSPQSASPSDFLARILDTIIQHEIVFYYGTYRTRHHDPGYRHCAWSLPSLTDVGPEVTGVLVVLDLLALGGWACVVQAIKHGPTS